MLQYVYMRIILQLCGSLDRLAIHGNTVLTTKRRARKYRNTTSVFLFLWYFLVGALAPPVVLSSSPDPDIAVEVGQRALEVLARVHAAVKLKRQDRGSSAQPAHNHTDQHGGEPEHVLIAVRF